MSHRTLRVVLALLLGSTAACGDSSATGGEPADAALDGDAIASDTRDDGPDAADASDASPGDAADAGSDAADAPAEATDPNEAYRVACITKINALRATRGLAPYARWTSAETCVDQQATHDESVNSPHDAYENGTPSCGGSGQNECLAGGPASLEHCIQMMWDERTQTGCAGCDACDLASIFAGTCPSCTFSGPTVCGHYVNLSATSYSKAACGFSAGGAWSAINFE